ncbi:polysaccharide deacetylase family protein [Pleionea sediminis]|uniref:polysaccharide deacetylase family protein n=1 Tax=Pleionea sediminis TaxID=2569479 RepID=UPI0011849FFA|nr:polysaccharide deacetylase family protein [Pleionea sediminis]
MIPNNVFWLFILLMINQAADCQSVALTFDDGLDPSRQPQAKKWNQSILTHLSQAKVRAHFFVTGERVNSTDGLRLVKDWSQYGHFIANHTYSHWYFHSEDISIEQFVQDIKRNEELLEHLDNWNKRFRFPYLKQGNTFEKRDGVRDWLALNGYEIGSVSIDASDWYYDQIYRTLLHAGEEEKIKQLRDRYLEHLWERAKYYDELSQKLLNRSIRHVLLLHTNAINAAFLGDVINMFKQKGWSLIDSEKAFQDEVYEQQPDILPAGESILWSIAKSRNVEGLRYPAESKRYEMPKLIKYGIIIRK